MRLWFTPLPPCASLSARADIESLATIRPAIKRAEKMRTRGLLCLLLLSMLTGCAAPNGRRQVVSTDRAPKAIGPYSQAIRAGDTLYVAGQIALDPTTGEMVTGGIKTQTHQVLKNIGAILDAAGFSFNDAVQCQVFLTDLSYYSDMNQAYGEYFRTNPPARAVIQVSRIPRDGLLEIMVVAVKSPKR